MTTPDYFAPIDALASALCALSDEIWDCAELSLQEYRSAQCLEDFLRAQGFAVTTGVAGIETAFSAVYGSGKPVIGLLAEYDALAGLSQKPRSAVCEAETAGGCGHGCGHNLLGAGAAAAAVAVKAYLARKPAGSGTVILYGCPGEEGGAAKAFMAREKLFYGLDAALTWHPGDSCEVVSGSNQTSLQVLYRFGGVASHAAEAPHMGRSALDGVELMNMGVQFLREHIPHTDAVHYAILDGGGVSPNVVQSHASVLYMVRSDTVPHAKALLSRLDNIAKGAALMTDTTIDRRFIDGTAELVSSRTLETLLYRTMGSIPLPDYTAEEQAFAAALYGTFPHGTLPGEVWRCGEDCARQVKTLTGNGTKPLNDFLMPYCHSELQHFGSTDVGDVSWQTPTAQFHAPTWVSGAPGHSWQNVSIGKHAIAHKGMLYAGKVLCAAAIALFEDNALLQKARAEWAEKTQDGYVCPIEPGVMPTVPTAL